MKDGIFDAVGHVQGHIKANEIVEDCFVVQRSMDITKMSAKARHNDI